MAHTRIAQNGNQRYPVGPFQEETDIVLQVDDIYFHVHKSVFGASSNLLRRMFLENPLSEQLELPQFPGGAEAFEYVFKLCYCIRAPLKVSTTLPFLAAAAYLGLESENALIAQAVEYLSEPAFYKDWESCAGLLQSCNHPEVLEYAKKCKLLRRCIRTIKSTADFYFGERQVFEASSSSQVQVDDKQKQRFLEQFALLYLGQVREILPELELEGLLLMHNAALSLQASQECLDWIESTIPDLDEFSPNDLYALDITTMQKLINFYLHKDEEISTMVNLVDDYLNKNAATNKVSVAQFQGLADSVRLARLVDDNLYYAIDMYLEAHPNLAEWEKEQICKSLTCKNLSYEVQNHASERGVLSLKTTLELYSINNQKLKHEVQDNKRRISALEVTVDNLRKEMEKLGGGKSKGWTGISKKLGFNKNMQVCTTSQDAVHNPNPMRRRDNLDSE